MRDERTQAEKLSEIPTFTADEVEGYLLGIGSPGVCINESCGEFDEYAGCEPDAEGYECPACGLDTLWGLEAAFMSGKVVVTDD